MGLRVMIVDDAPFIREVLGHIARKGGFDIVAEASDGEEAVRVALEVKPDIIIMDIVMPKKSGIEATREILKARPLTKVVACTTEGQENMILKAMEAGCCDCILKPFQVDDVIRVLNATANKEAQP